MTEKLSVKAHWEIVLLFYELFMHNELELRYKLIAVTILNATCAQWSGLIIPRNISLSDTLLRHIWHPDAPPSLK
jgi:hypothetical protein